MLLTARVSLRLPSSGACSVQSRRSTSGVLARLGFGSAEDLAKRLGEHRQGTGARLTQVAKERGIGWDLARVWEGGLDGRKLEKNLKARHNGKALCPICAGVVSVPDDVNFYG